MTARRTVKKYYCSACGYVTQTQTNHYNQIKSSGIVGCCPECLPYDKFRKFGGHTTWICSVPRRKLKISS